MSLFIVAVVVVTLLWLLGVTENIFINVWRLYANFCCSCTHLGWI